MRCSLFLLALSGSVQAYRLSEYTGRQCTTAEVDIIRLTGPTTCTKLNHDVAASVLVKVDNIHDGLYAVNVYENEDCTGDIVGSIANLNGCLDLDAFPNIVGKAVQVVPLAKDGDSSAVANKGFVTDLEYNFPEQMEGKMKVPVMHGGFRTIITSEYSDDGTYLDEAFGLFHPISEEHLAVIHELWANRFALSPDDSGQ